MDGGWQRLKEHRFVPDDMRGRDMRQSGNILKFLKDKTLSSLNHQHEGDAIIFVPAC